MAAFVAIAGADDLVDGQMKKVDIGGRRILLARVDGSYYAVDSRCPHMGGDLSQSSLNGTVVTCPRHRSQFDVRDGRVIQWTDWTGLKLTMARLLRSPRALTTYETKREGDSILARLG